MKFWNRSKPQTTSFNDPAHWFSVVKVLIDNFVGFDSDGNRYRVSYSIETISAAAYLAASEKDNESAIATFLSTLKRYEIPKYLGEKKTT